MDRRKEWEPFYRAVLEHVTSRVDALLVDFGQTLKSWLEQILNNPIHPNWRDQIMQFRQDCFFQGIIIRPESLAAIDELIESRIHGTGRFAARGPARRATAQWEPDHRFVQNPFPNPRPPADPLPPAQTKANRHLPDGSFVQTVVPQASEFSTKPPDPNSARDNSSPFIVNGVEVAGPGPTTTSSYRDKVALALAFLDPLVAEWWTSISIQGDVRARSVVWGWSYYTQVEKDQPVIVVDKSFTPGQTALAIVERAYTTSDPFEIAFTRFRDGRKDAAQVFAEQRKRAGRDAAQYATALADTYVGFAASFAPGGSLILTIDDAAKNGPQLQHVLVTLPLLAVFLRSFKLLIIKIGRGKNAKTFTVSKSQLEEFNQLTKPAQKTIIAEAQAAKTLDKVADIIRKGIAARRIEGHHQLPKQFADRFQRVGLNIEDYVIPLDKAAHRLRPSGLHTGVENWNSIWNDFFKTKQNPSKRDILKQLKKMRKQFGLE